METILVTGGAGYVGSVLIPTLLLKGFRVKVIDLFLYGDNLQCHDNLLKLYGDIRDQNLMEKALDNCDAVIHLACVSNDPSFDLNPKLGKSINYDSFRPIVEKAIKKKIKLFIYASSSSVYGLKNESEVTEELSLNPLTDYSKYKAMCEDILFSYDSNNFTPVVVRPATVCGYSPRQRFDLVVNLLTNQAWNKRKIKIFNGNQTRPNIHIKDMVDAYCSLLEADKTKINHAIFNVGCENYTLSEIGNMIKSKLGQDIITEEIFSNDNRSYKISSKKIRNILGIDCTFTISDAIDDLQKGFSSGLFQDSLNNSLYFNIKRMKEINLN